MQNSRLLTIEGRLKVKILSGVIMLLLVGVHPVRVFADADGSSSSPDSSATVTATPTDPTTDSTTSGSGQTTTPTTDPTDTSDSTDTSSSNTPQTTPTDTSDTTPTDTSDATTAPSETPSNTTDTQSDDSTTTVNNQATSDAQSGNASVSQSSTAGNATSGNATTIATALNILSSSTDVQNNNVNTAVTNISGNDNNQNVVVDPTTSSGDPTNSQGATEVNTSTSGTIDNDLTLGATSGDATVSGNGVGGNATTGDATVDANLINITNSDLNSGQYYIGVINIYGDLSANILLSPEFVSQLLSENPSLLSGDTSATNNVNQTINNEINANAISGNASVENNFLGGNATSGNATTSVDTFDLANTDITGNDALLVFINVLGTWEGVIIGAPTGATTAVYGNNTTDQGTAAPTTPSDTGSQTTLASATNEEIDNTINADATSGNATVAYNGVGGNATSGNAAVSVNLLNILNSDISLSGWFGVLFINVFGNWSGDFGVITPASTVVTTSAEAITGTANHLASIGQSIAHDTYTIFDQSSISNPTPGQVLGATTSATTNDPLSNNSGSRIVASTSHDSRTWWLPAAVGMILASASLGLEQVLRRRQS